MPFQSPGSSAKSGPLRYTNNYVYNNADCVGKGATANVYLGRDRNNGKQVAIKVFSEHESRQISVARQRETELLKAVNHRNVMKLLACETDTISGQQVIVMPYCQGGSVYALLDQPQNGFGFQEDEFLIFLNDITDGLKYLNQQGIVHRDIKPGNIMKRIEEDGSSVYILTDFGAARELGDEETFMSIYGTEEYIHPHMFQRAVLREPGQNQFTSSVDLWSLAVTVYHVATGKLPFQAFGGRNDSQMMFKIMSERASGEISGIQLSPEGQVRRSKHLPETCYLSKGLCRNIEPILQGLFDIDETRAWNFDQYFEAVHKVVNMKTLKVFNARTSTQLILYLNKTDSYTHIQEKIASITEVRAERQLLLLAHAELKDIVEPDVQLQTYPKSVQNAQFFLFEKDTYDVGPLHIPELPLFPSFSVNSSLSNDSSVAKQCSAAAYYIEWKTKEVKEWQTLVLESKLYLRLYVQNALAPILKITPELDKELTLTKKRSDGIRLSQSNIDTVVNVIRMFDIPSGPMERLEAAVRSFSTKDGGITEIMEKTGTRCEEIKLYTSVLSQRLSEVATPSPTDHLGCQEEEHCLSKVGHIKQGIQNIASTFSKHKKYGELHQHENFIHQVERKRLEDFCVTIVSLFSSHCVNNLKQVHVAVNKQISILLKHLTRTGKVETNIKCVVDCQTQINDKLDQMDGQYKVVSELLQKSVKDFVQSASGSSKVHHREPSEFTESSEGLRSTSYKTDEKSLLIKRIRTEVSKLETERTELDSMMDSNTQCLLEIKKILQDTSRLSISSFQYDKSSVNTEQASSNMATGFQYDKSSVNTEQASSNMATGFS